jgi:hypothetical protein
MGKLNTSASGLNEVVSIHKKGSSDSMPKAAIMTVHTILDTFICFIANSSFPN